MSKPTLTWTGASSRGSLLYQAYRDHADVHLEGQRIGYILQLHNGLYQPRLDGMMGDPVMTADSAARIVVEMHRKFRSR